MLYKQLHNTYPRCKSILSARDLHVFKPIGLLLGLLISCVVLLILNAPALAVVTPVERPLLTLDVLQERLKSPIQTEGNRILDLRRLTIDLRPENAEFRDQFYGRLQSQLQASGTPLGLDLSYSRVKGDFTLSKLGLRAPLYGQALSPIFSDAEKAQLQRDRRRLLQLSQLSRSLLIAPSTNGELTSPSQLTIFRGPVKVIQTRFEGVMNAANTFFLSRLEAQGAEFTKQADWLEARYSQTADFTGALFRADARFRSSIFLGKAGFSQAQFKGVTNFQGTEFRDTARFSQVSFQQTATFARTQWVGNADFSQTRWQGQGIFSKANFSQALFLTEASFEQTVLFQGAQFRAPVNLRGAQILSRADFSYTRFSPSAYLNIAGLEFDAAQARILGDLGQIGKVLSVPSLAGNETLFRNLVQNFRQQQQIMDANQVEYTAQRLRLKELTRKFSGTNVNAASVQQLQTIGFSAAQAEQIQTVREQNPLRTITELLSLDTIDLATYVKVRNRVVAEPASMPLQAVLNRINVGWWWLGLSLLLLLSRYGSSFGLVLGVGLVAIAYFGLLFWLLDRWRRFHPQPIRPTLLETIWVLSSTGLLALCGLTAIFRAADQPGWTLLCIGILTLPLPLGLTLRVYQQGRFHNLMHTSYFMEEGTLRQLRLLIGRLPIIPRYQMFRERYMPLLWERNWNWLNYYDFSLNNLLRFGFNDIRLRDEHLPGLITTLVWYQWGLGVLYISLLLWTLSRTIPGLNLLIYLK
jgi:hypothetical protein